MAIGHRYDSRYLRNRIVGIEGFDVDFPVIPGRGEGEGSERMVAPGEPYMAPSGIFTAMAADPPYDVGEQAFSTYVQAVARGDDVTAIPVFPSRLFPHVQVCVRADSDIGSPVDLIGKRFALGSFSINFGIWLRGILDHQYGVDTTAITWVTSRDEYYGFTPPERFAVERAPRGATALSLLRDGVGDRSGHGQQRPSHVRPRQLRIRLHDSWARGHERHARGAGGGAVTGRRCCGSRNAASNLGVARLLVQVLV